MWLTTILVVFFITWLWTINYKLSRNLILDSLILEVRWTIIPVLILSSIAVPSVYLLCYQDSSVPFPKLSLKLLRRQWIWQRSSPERLDHLLDQDKLDEIRGYDSPVVIPSNIPIRFLLTRRDVLHSLGIPRIGVKLDSNPGRLNATLVETISQSSLIWGSCFELCGRGHRAMPIFFFSS